MTKDDKSERDETELDPETVEDLEPQDDEARNVRGGSLIACQAKPQDQ